MADIELVIKIPEEYYKDIKVNGLCGYSSDREIVSKSIANGTPLPKGHGRLIETDEIIAHLKAHENLLIRHYAGEGGNIPFEINSRIDQIHICMDDITNAPTIIEADKDGDEE